jgi:hypothetical protein
VFVSQCQPTAYNVKCHGLRSRTVISNEAAAEVDEMEGMLVATVRKRPAAGAPRGPGRPKKDSCRFNFNPGGLGGSVEASPPPPPPSFVETLASAVEGRLPHLGLSWSPFVAPGTLQFVDIGPLIAHVLPSAATTSRPAAALLRAFAAEAGLLGIVALKDATVMIAMPKSRSEMTLRIEAARRSRSVAAVCT